MDARLSPPGDAPTPRSRGLLPRPRPSQANPNPASPRREIVGGLAVIGVFLAVFVGWGLVAHLDAGVYAPGAVTVYGNRQSVQHRDGGIVSELDVHEGDRVQDGQVLLKLSGDELKASEQAMANEVFTLEALQARLLAEMNGRGSITPPADFQGLTGDDAAAAQGALAIQQHEFSARNAELSTQQAVLRQREAQSADEIDGYQQQLTSSRRQQALVQQERGSLKNLLAQGLVPLTRERSLERDQAQLEGAAGEYTADIARTQQQVGETRLQSVDLQRQRIADDSKDYRDADSQLSQARPKLIALRQQIDRLTVRAPATGRVVGLSIFTVGGVVAPGQKLMDIVPENEPLVIEARVKPNDADDLKVGQSTEIRIPAFSDRRLPLLTGKVRSISADALTDEKTGMSFFRIEVEVPPSQLQVIRQVRGAEAGLKPGLPVEVVVPLRNRTALGYLLDPLRELLWKSFRQH